MLVEVREVTLATVLQCSEVHTYNTQVKVHIIITFWMKFYRSSCEYRRIFEDVVMSLN